MPHYPHSLTHHLFQLKLQFDDSLTVTFEYPSENSLLDDEGEGPGPGEEHGTPPDTPATHHALPNNAVLGEI